MTHNKHTAERYALEDMVTFFNEEGKKPLISPSHLATKRIRMLNRELGLASINHYGNTRGKKS